MRSLKVGPANPHKGIGKKNLFDLGGLYRSNRLSNPIGSSVGCSETPSSNRQRNRPIFPIALRLRNRLKKSYSVPPF